MTNFTNESVIMPSYLMDCQWWSMETPSDGHLYCDAKSDRFFCWNYTVAGTIAAQPCPPFPFFSKHGYAYKECTSNGTWFVNPVTGKEWVNMQECIPSVNYATYVYVTGYSVSIVALLVSLIVLSTLKRIQCDRIRLHQNLFVCHLLNATLQLIFMVVNNSRLISNALCHALFIVSTFFSLATYYWMFAEGLYLLVVLLCTFHTGNILLLLCMLSGWGIPLIITCIYVIIRYSMDNKEICILQSNTNLTYLFLVPVLISIVANVIFMILILRMLVIKMREQATATPIQQSWWKAAKAILILTPVLGLYYLLVLVQPDEHQTKLFSVHKYVSAVAVSFQGLLVTMPFCFFNQEVHEALKHRVRQLRDQSSNNRLSTVTLTKRRNTATMASQTRRASKRNTCADSMLHQTMAENV